MSEFKKVTNTDAPDMEVRVIEEREKAIHFELKLKLWLPKKVVKFENDKYFIPFWIVKNALK